MCPARRSGGVTEPSSNFRNGSLGNGTSVMWVERWRSSSMG
jgi:hypothetical protein